MASLIQQRSELDRQRGRARIPLALAVVWVFLGTLMVWATASPWIPWAYFAVGVLSALHGWSQLKAVRRAVAAFEAEHGPGAGVQKPLR
jgi:hypothetical protein